MLIYSQDDGVPFRGIGFAIQHRVVRGWNVHLRRLFGGGLIQVLQFFF
jgi:hypothetical protein